jgi:hypothetical protein
VVQHYNHMAPVQLQLNLLTPAPEGHRQH